MDNMHRLEEIFARFPGIGPRQAKRFVYHVQSRTSAAVKEMADLIREIKSSTVECSDCHRFFIDKNGKNNLCNICNDESRDGSRLMVVARDSDLESIEKSGAYKGLYFVLGGTVPILDKEPERRVRLGALMERMTKGKEGIKEMILSMNLTPEGENTADVVKEAITAQKKGATKVTILGRGLSTGAELEYVDSDTIRNALENRH